MSTLGMGGIDPGAASAVAGGTGAGATAKSKAASEDSAAVTNFMNYMKETPAQRIEDMWLQAHGLSEKKLAAMSPKQREAVMKQMADDIKKQMQDAVKKAQTAGKTSIASAISG